MRKVGILSNYLTTTVQHAENVRSQYEHVRRNNQHQVVNCAVHEAEKQFEAALVEAVTAQLEAVTASDAADGAQQRAKLAQEQLGLARVQASKLQRNNEENLTFLSCLVSENEEASTEAARANTEAVKQNGDETIILEDSDEI